MENSLYNQTRLQEYLDDTLWKIDVKKNVVIDGVDYWSIYHGCDICEIMQKLGCVNYIKLSGTHILIKHDDLVEKYGDLFHFDDGFSVKGKSINEIEDRLESFDFDNVGLFIDNEMGSRVCFIRVNSISQSNCNKLSNILNLGIGKIGRLEDKEGYLPLFWGNGWFYFEV